MGKLKLPNTIKMVITDFDGILTDNCVYIDEKFNKSRKINFSDIMGMSLLRRYDYKIAMISGEINPLMDMLSERFSIEENHQNIREKIEILEKIIQKYELSQEEYLYIGDDVNDKLCLEHAKYRITVPNAASKVKEIEGIQITANKGGEGAFREVADCLIGLII